MFLDLINAVAELADPVRVVEQLAPLSPAGHVKDFIFRSIQQPDGYHRRGFEVLYRYPGEGVAPLSRLVAALLGGVWEVESFTLPSKGSIIPPTSTTKRHAWP